jgi:hypothetical protein
MIFLFRKIYLFLFLLLSFECLGQATLLAIGSEWDDQLSEWFVMYDDEEEGVLERTWRLGNDWSEWSYEVGDYSGSIQQKWSNRPWYWELRSDDGLFITMDVKWRGDITEWEIKYGGQRLKYYMPDRSDYGYWVLDHEELGYWEFLTSNYGDIRDWESVDELQEVDFELKITLAFISLISNMFS